MIEITCPIAAAAARSGDSPAVVSSDRVTTYAQLNQQVEAAVRALKQNNVLPSTRVAVTPEPGPEFITVLFALFRLRAVACLISKRMPLDGRQRQAEAAGCRTQILLSSQSDENLVPGMRKVWVDCSLSSTDHETSSGDQFSLAQPATVMFTSGSSGNPKGVLHSLGNHYWSAVGSNSHLPFAPGDLWLVTLPLYHVGGLAIIFRSLLAGGTVVFPAAGESIVESVEKYKPTHLSLVATQLSRVLALAGHESSFNCLKAVLLGGGPVPPGLIDRAKAASLPTYVSYGLTEMASHVATSAIGDPRVRPLPHRRLMIDEDSEILVSGDTRFLGYVNGDELQEPFDADGWFKTGDLGLMDDSESLQVFGRRDNMFVSGGENIHPEQIERVLCSLAGVDDVIVVPVDDEGFGQRPVAFVRTSYQLNPDAYSRAVARVLPRFMIPKAYLNWPDDLDDGALKTARQVFADRARALCSNT